MYPNGTCPTDAKVTDISHEPVPTDASVWFLFWSYILLQTFSFQSREPLTPSSLPLERYHHVIFTPDMALLIKAIVTDLSTPRFSCFQTRMLLKINHVSFAFSGMPAAMASVRPQTGTIRYLFSTHLPTRKHPYPRALTSNILLPIIFNGSGKPLTLISHNLMPTFYASPMTHDLLARPFASTTTVLTLLTLPGYGA